MADTPIATQEEIAAAQAREAAGAAAAAAANAAWRNNTNPILPVMGSSSGITQAEQADAAREAAKHAAAFHPAEYYGVNPASLGNVPLSQIASRYGTGFADIVQGYYTQNPTAEAQAIKQQYAATRGGATENPYDPDTAAGIAWLSARQGTPVSASLGQKAIQQGYQGDLYAVSGISTVPTRDYSSGMLTGSKMVAALPDKTTTVYMPYGEYAQIEMKGAKALLDYQTGELGVYQRPYGHSSYMLTGGGGRAALQSGMFTVEKPETPYVVSQEGVGKYVMPSGAGLSRLGAEAYGGVVRPLDERTLAPNEAISRYAGTTGRYNLANLVQQIPAGKAEVPGAKIPWAVEAGTPELSYMGAGGIIPGSAIALPSGSGRLVGSKVIAGSPTYGNTEAGALPAPFKSTTAPSAATVAAQNEYQPSGFLGLGGLLPAMPSYEKTKAYSVDVMSRMVAAGPIGGLGIIAKEEFGAPISTVAGVTSRLSSGTSEIIFKPEPVVVSVGSKETTKTEAFQLPITRTTEITNLPKSTTISGGNKTISDLGDWLTGSRGSIDRTNLTAVKEYNTKSDLFTKMQEQNPVFVTTTGGTKATTTETGGTRILTTTTGESGSKVYASEWDRFVEGSGRVARYVTGMPLAKQEAYFETIKNEQGIVGEAKRGLFFIGTTITNKPAELAPAAVLGFGIRQAAAMAPGFLGEVAAGSGVTAKAAQFLQTPGGVSLAKAGMLAGFGGAYVYDVTDKLTATAEKTKENIYRSIPALAAMYAGGGGVDWVGETKIVNRVDVSTGTTFKGVQIYDTVFGGGKTPNGGGYAVGAYSPTESHTFPVKPPAPPTASGATPPTPAGQLKLPSGSGGYGAETYPSSFEGPVRDYSKMDISGGARPFSVKTAAEAQAEALVKYRDTSGVGTPFSIRTQGEMPTTPPSPSTVIATPIIGDFSGGAPQFSMKTQGEIAAGVWDTAVRIGGDISGKSRPFSMQTETEFFSGLPRDVSGKGEPISIRAQEEILAGWEQERAGTNQIQANLQWVQDVIGGKSKPVSPSYDISRIPEGQQIPQSKIPSLADDMFTAGAALSPTPRVIATTPTGEVVGAAAYRIVPLSGEKPSSIYIDYIGSGKSGVGTKLVGDIKSIAAEQGISIITGKTVPRSAGFWEKMGADIGATAEGGAPFEIDVGIPKKQVSAKVEAPRKQYTEPRAPFSIPGVSEAAISAELAGMHPALRELALGATAPTYAEGFGPIHESVITRSKVETGIGQPERGFLYDIQTGSLVGTVTGESAGGISGQAKASMLQDVFASKKQYGSKGFAYYHTHPDTGLAEYDTVKSVPSKLDITRRHEWRRIVKREGVISSGNVVEWQPTALPPHRTKTIDRLSTSLETFIQAGTKYGLKPSVVLFTPPEQSAKVTRGTPSVVPYKTTTPREISVTTTRQTPTVVPYRITTPREGTITTTSTRGQETPWARTTEKPSPTKTITPIPPVPVPPLTGMFTWPGGTSGSTPGRKPRRAAFMETFMMGLDVGFGLGGRRPRAKSYTTPKKYKTKAPAAKKKGGKK